jgi:transcriptional regulator of acetoin/glycerol metabolism
MSHAMQLVIVRRSQFAAFGNLSRAFAAEPNVRLIWDRRVQNRRRRAAPPAAGERRRQEHRRDPSAGWDDRDYLVIGAMTDGVSLDPPRPSLTSARALTAARKAREDVRQDLEAAGRSDVNVLITGGDSISRRSLARQIHQGSDRRDGPFVVIDRPVAGRLFGGSGLERAGRGPGGEAPQRGPSSKRPVLGTLLIEEVADLSWAQQTELLLFLERRASRRTRAETAVTHDPRLIAATSDWLPDRIASSQFRDDLFYRLNLIHFVLPADTVTSLEW